MIRTNCGNCSFYSGICELGRVVEHKDTLKYNPGFCRFKRKNVAILEYIKEEEQKLSIIILHNGNRKDLQITLESIKKFPQVKQVILSCIDDFNYFRLLKNAEIKGEWTSDRVFDKSYEDTDKRLDYSSRLIKNRWFMPIKSGQEIHKGVIDRFNKEEDNLKGNFFVVLDEGFYGSIINTSVFMDLEGNKDIHFFSKLAEMDKEWAKYTI